MRSCNNDALKHQKHHEFRGIARSQLLLPGLADVQKGKPDAVGALLVVIAATRLTQAGLNVPSSQLLSEPGLRLYALP